MKTLKTISTLILCLLALCMYSQAVCISGDCKNGKGTKTYKNGDKYTGEFKSSTRHGHGKYTWKSGSYYVGYWENGDFNGYGVRKKLDGTVIQGIWKNDKLVTKTGCLSGDCKDGFGTRVYESGDKYTGNFKFSIRNGQGKYFWTNKNVYEGNWKNGKMHGQGSLIYSDGSSEIGNYENGKFTPMHNCVSGNCKNGYGKILYENGHQYTGYFKNEYRHGNGHYKWTDDTEYNGDWKNGKRDGFGITTEADGSIVKGNWENDTFIEQLGCISGDCKNGQGVYVYMDGHIYNGSFKFGFLHGEGRMYDKNEILRYHGEYEYGKKSGFGDTFYPNGSMHFMGEFKNDAPFQGHVRLESNEVTFGGPAAGPVVYDGRFNSNFEPHGYGVSYDEYKNLLFRGFWEFGEPKQRTDIHGNPISNSRSVDFAKIGVLVLGVIAALSSNDSEAPSADLNSSEITNDSSILSTGSQYETSDYNSTSSSNNSNSVTINKYGDWESVGLVDSRKERIIWFQSDNSSYEEVVRIHRLKNGKYTSGTGFATYRDGIVNKHEFTSEEECISETIKNWLGY